MGFLDNENGSIQPLPGHPDVLVIEFKGFVPESTFKYLWQLLREQLNQKSWNGILINASQVVVVAPQTQKWLIDVWFRATYAQLGCNIPIAVINSQEFFGKIVTKRIIDHLVEWFPTIQVELFSEDRDAKHWLVTSKEDVEKTKIQAAAEHEAARLDVLRKYEILDTEPEEEFDALTSLVSTILDVPISLVSLIDKDRQWFKSRVGLDAEETHRDISFCQYAIMQESVYEVTNALEHDLFKENPLVLKEPKIRFYAGAPLKDSNGYNLGTLCVIDHRPRQFNDDQRDILGEYAKQVVRLIEQRGR